MKLPALILTTTPLLLGLLLLPTKTAVAAEITSLMTADPEQMTPQQLRQRRRDTERFYSGGADLRANNPFAGKFTNRVLPNQNGSVP